MTDKRDKLKIQYDYNKTWLMIAISLFMTSSIGIFAVPEEKVYFKTALAIIWIVSVVLYFWFYNKFHKTYNSLK